MESIKIRCRLCGKELESYSSKSVSCGCPNMATISGDKIFANDLSQIVMLTSPVKNKKNVLTNEDIIWQQNRRQRKVRKLDYEVR